MCCRPACHLLDALFKVRLVPYSSVAEVAEAMVTAVELNGPAIVADASCAFLATLIRVRGAENPSAFASSSDRVLNWVFGKWLPSKFDERTHTLQLSQTCCANDVAKLLSVCADKPFAPSRIDHVGVFGLVGTAWVRAARDTPLVNYLLLADDPIHLRNAEFAGMTATKQEVTTTVHSDSHSLAAETLIFDFCIGECDRARSTLQEWVDEKPQSITPDIVRVLSALCIVTSTCLSSADNTTTAATGTAAAASRPTRKIDTLRGAVHALISDVARFLARSDCEQDRVDAALAALSQHLPPVASLKSLHRDVFARAGAFPFALHMSKTLDERAARRGNWIADSASGDLMDLDDEFDSQISHRNRGDMNRGPTACVPRNDVVAMADMMGLRTEVSLYAYLIAFSFEEATLRDGEASVVPSAFVEKLVSLPALEFLASRAVVVGLLESDLQLKHEDLERMFENLGEKLMAGYEYERNEVALGMSLEALTATAVFWSDPGSGKLFDLVEDMYRWFIRVGLKPGLTSSAVHIGITNMLHSLLRVRPEYNVQLELPPIRESLFDILAVSDIPVKFHLTDILADIFGLFVLAEHDAIFEEVHAALVKLKDWHEDIFVWLVVLARLASTWQTLLRRCVYHIFEMAGAVHWATGHAARCIADVARALQLAGGANELFRLFAPQLLFTWGDCKFPLSNMPYVVFGYKSLKELILDVEDEVAGQVFMRANETDITALSAELDLSPAQLIERSFVKVAAYCISWDIRASLPGTGGAVASTPTTGTTPTTSTNESKARQHMGKEAYLKRLRQAFPRILSQFFVTMEGEDTIEHGIEKAFARRTTTMGASAKALNNMKAISSSGMSLPSGQQPLFKGRFLLDQIERLCRRSGDDPNHLWTPQLFTIVLRVLLDRIDPALGSLAACAFIRKIRILIVLAGPDVVGAGYPLEMALHALRPFLTNPHSADDALGIVQWLLDIGKDYLQAHLSFVAGFSLAVLIQLRVFLGSSQESTTQESQHMATMTKVHAFHTWFGSYLKSIRVPPGPPSPAFEAFRSMVRAACDIRSSGNAVKGTPESTLLFEVLLDEQQKKGLLDEPARVLALSLLCRDFRAPPPHHRDDILGADDTASEFAPLVWKSCLSVGAQSDGYLLWAARVLGRAYVSRNDFQQSLRRIVGGISPARKQLSDSEDTERSNINSRVAIVHAIADLFRSDERRHVGLAEETLRTMLARTADPVEMREIQEALPEMLVKALSLSNPEQAKLSTMRVQPELLKTRAVPEKEKEFRAWIRDLAIAVAGTTSNEVVIDSLPPILAGIAGLAEKLFPYILHNSLLRELDTQQHVRQVISEACQYWFENCNDATVPHAKILIEAILYLRTQPYPNEHTIADRQRWLELDYLQASEAAVKCGMHTTALLLAENHTPAAHTSRTSRRSSVLQQAPLPTSLLLQIYRNIEEPDSFYGVEQQPSLDSLLDRIDYEADGFKSLLLRGARLDSQMRRGDIISSNDAQGVVKSLIQLNLNSVTHSLLSRQQGHETGSDSVNCMLQTAMKLDQWDIKAPESAATETTTMFKAFQGLNRSANLTTAMAYLNEGFLNTLKGSISLNVLGPKMRSSLRTLASLTEMDEIVSIANPDDLREAFERMQNRQTWMDSALYEDIRPLLSYRGTLYSSLSCSDDLQSALHVRAKDCRRYEVQTLIRASSISRMHGALQESLTIATYLSDLVPVCRALGLAVEGAAQFETANVLWEQGEMTASVRILQHLVRDVNLDYEVDAAGKSVVLAKLGHHMAEARLEKGEEISQNYLIPAIRELKENTQGREAGQVYYEFASFCDRQLQNPDSLEDFTRMQKLVDRRRDEEDELSRITRSARSAEERRAHGRELSRVKKWLEIDGQEFQRLRVSRESFLRQSLENYLLCLQICDDFDSIVLRFFALWLENSGSSLANSAVRKNLREVPSRKFAVLMNQLSSRLQAEETDFQRLLSELVLRVCMQHPYHGMFQIYAGALGTDSREETAMSRKQAAKNIVSRFEKDKVAVSYWKAIYQSNSIYSMIAMTRDDGRDRFKAGRDYAINKFSAGVKLLQKIPTLQVPPATMSFEPRPDCNYTNLPKITHFKPRMTIAGGLSAPKIITAIASDGKQYKQLFKGGNDDLRQDAIMEQVFEEVSKLLKNNTATRQRDLHIRTYKVLPLSAQTGIMEFVQNTIALSSYLVPAHEKYHPKDWKNQTCRDKIDQVCKPTFSAEVRVKTFRTVTEHYQPVLRYFFLERFPDPDEWFQRRLAYTRTMAAISILGHVLGLGDRHCQNILLDEKSGEVVHIDLGVAFEAGRVLPIPEVVPFRLTRDLVDGMGYTKTEGVFRRCCEFTMDALREERESIMTLLNVLRYDPLYNWSVSPLKAKRIQEAQGNEGGGALDDAIDQASKRTEDEAGEAGRALSVVEKKLSKTLSTAATVNELIQQATDERNLALLFCGKLVPRIPVRKR
ncbi:hypothetical protein BDY21DRAFT_142648 [Lineolata rhizophorae]|uniref:Serine/threonine-protein kinase TEL1 n=1 Tax=Lineolata rhizophorae TaxID=578093 RepID=A0A6A6NNF8_9PEZI|nr:hypothetical protein BDY21DRAFT_142648 [Lineolata rhizophorae]